MKSAFTQKLDKTHTPIANTPYHQTPQVVVMPQNASSANDNDNKFSGELTRLKRDYTQLESKLKEKTPAITVEPVKTKTPEVAPVVIQQAVNKPPEEIEMKEINKKPDRGSDTGGYVRTEFTHFKKPELKLLSEYAMPNTPISALKKGNIVALLREYIKYNNLSEQQLITDYFTQGGTGEKPENDGMTTSKIADFLEIKTHHICPVIAKDQMDLLLPFVNSDTKQFYFVINSDPISKNGTHWRAGGIDMNEGSCFFYDPLANDCDMSFQKGMKALIDKINPHFYLKFKINKIKDQSSKSANCGDFCCKWVDAMWSGKPFKEATKYNVVNGEKDIEKYKMKWNLI
jgi:hypothetical protein